MKILALRAMLIALPLVIKVAAKKHENVRRHLRAKDLTLEIGLRDGRAIRHFVFRSGKVMGRAGPAPSADASMKFKSADTALAVMSPNPNYAVVLDALKNFKATASGQDDCIVWFGQLMNMIASAGWKYGQQLRDGTTRYANLTNGGPVHVYVKDGKIVRITPIDLDDADAASWKLKARGRVFTPMRRATVSVHALSLKSNVYSDTRIMYPMRRVDFDPAGERNPHMRGKSGYVRISWDEALTIVTDEIKRMRSQHGNGAIAVMHPAHHQWGNVNYWLSALTRFANIIGTTKMGMSPISWEGWYWGAQHHFGGNLRVGLPSFYGTLEDCLQEAELIVFWSSDPESTSGVYAGGEGTQRRLWAKELGIEFVHIDPHYNKTAQLLGGKWIPVKAGTDPALAIAIMYQWVQDGLYDKDYVARNSTGFDEWRDYLLGVSDGQPKTPEWQEGETGVPARDVRSLARLWGGRKTYLAAGGLGAGFGGACRGATGAQWARCMVQMMAMQGWGKPGVNFGNLQIGAPMDHNFYFPGYSEGGISGDVVNTGSALNNYTRMPHALTMNTCKQLIPRQHFPEGIIEGHCTGHLWDGFSLEAQFPKYEYPLPGHSRIHMLYRYGGSSLGTVTNSARYIEAYRHPSLEFVVNQSIWLENEVQFADVILPACTSFERWDIAESANSGGYITHCSSQLNHRIVVMQHKAIEPLGESKSDYQIFLAILTRLGAGALFSEGGCDELTWCKRVFDSSDLPKVVSWKDFLKKGYHVIAPDPEAIKTPVEMRWFAEGRAKDTPEMNPLPGQYSQTMGQGLGTPSGKFEFVPATLRRIEAEDPERPALNKYIPAWEGPRSLDAYAKFPLQLITSHAAYSFHTFGDGKKTFINDIQDHRVLVDGYYYWVVRISVEDARHRGLEQHDLVRVFNDRGAVICALDVSPLLARGVVKSFESCAVYDEIQTSDGAVDRGGCLNLLTPQRVMTKTADGIAPNSCLVEISKWDRVILEAA